MRAKQGDVDSGVSRRRALRLGAGVAAAMSGLQRSPRVAGRRPAVAPRPT